METPTLTRTFPSTLKQIKLHVNEILDFLTTELNELSDEEYFELRLIFSELLINAVTHGNQNKIGKHIFVTVEILSNHTIFSKISDEGNGFYLKEQEQDPLVLEEHGRGLKIVSSLADEFSTNLKGNALLFKKKLKKKVTSFETERDHHSPKSNPISRSS